MCEWDRLLTCLSRFIPTGTSGVALVDVCMRVNYTILFRLPRFSERRHHRARLCLHVPDDGRQYTTLANQQRWYCVRGTRGSSAEGKYHTRR